MLVRCRPAPGGRLNTIRCISRPPKHGGECGRWWRPDRFQRRRRWLHWNGIRQPDEYANRDANGGRQCVHRRRWWRSAGCERIQCRWRWIHRNSIRKPDEHANRNADGIRESVDYSGTIREPNGHTDGDPNLSNANPNADGDANATREPDEHANWNKDSIRESVDHADAIRELDEYADSDVVIFCDSDANPNPDGNANAIRKPDEHANRNTDCIRESVDHADAIRESDEHADSDIVGFRDSDPNGVHDHCYRHADIDGTTFDATRVRHRRGKP